MPDRLETAGLAGLLATLGGIWRWLASRRNREADLDVSQANALKTSWEAQAQALKALDDRLTSYRDECSDLRKECTELRLQVRELQVDNEALKRKNNELEGRLAECERRWAARDRGRNGLREAG